MNAAVALVLCEAVLSTVAVVHPTPLLASSEVHSRLKAWRRPAGHMHFGYRLNSGGFTDEEFFVGEEGDLVVAALADSFGLGVVPPDSNFLTVAERRLATRVGNRFRRIAIQNWNGRRSASKAS